MQNAKGTPMRRCVIPVVITLVFAVSARAQTFKPRAIFEAAATGVVDITTPYGQGAGFFVNSDGWVATNRHVIENEYEELSPISEIHVFCYKETRAYSVERVIDVSKGQRDEFGLSQPDLVLLKTSRLDSRPLPLTRENNTPIGEEVVAIGHPRGLLWTQTTGTVSNNSIPSLLQMQTPSNPGNSGGPLLNPAGKVVGIVTLGMRQVAENTNFAIKAKLLREALEEYNITYETTALLQSAQTLSENSADRLQRDRDTLEADRLRLRLALQQFDAEKDSFREQQVEDARTHADAQRIREELDAKATQLKELGDSLSKLEIGLEAKATKLREDSLSLQRLRESATYLFPARFSFEALVGMGYWFFNDSLAFGQPQFSVALLHRFDLDMRQDNDDHSANRFGVQYSIFGLYDSRAGSIDRRYSEALQAILDFSETLRLHAGQVFKGPMIDYIEPKWIAGMDLFFSKGSLPIVLTTNVIADNRFFRTTFAVGLSLGFRGNFLRW